MTANMIVAVTGMTIGQTGVLVFAFSPPSAGVEPSLAVGIRKEVPGVMVVIEEMFAG